MTERYGAETTVPERRERLRLLPVRSRKVDMVVVTGTERR
jgi:hypothetical protein